jgi:hypothetical protein
LLDDDRNVFHLPAKAQWNAAQRVLNQEFEFGNGQHSPSSYRQNLDSLVNRMLGLALMGLVVLKLYLSDVWELGRVFRITAFLGLGVLLLLASYLYS